MARKAIVAVLTAASAGCAVGPNFEPAAVPKTEKYLPGQLASPAGNDTPRVQSQHFITGAQVSARWWSAFKSRQLNTLIKRSVDHNPNLQAADAAIKVAQYNAQAQRGLFFPQISGNTNASNQLISNNVMTDPTNDAPQMKYSLFTHQLSVSFVPDIWGANARAVENLDAQTEQQLFQLEAAYLTLTSNVVTAAIQEASLRGQIVAVRRVIEIQKSLLAILKTQLTAGQAAQVDVLVQDAALAQAEQLLPPLEKQLGLQRDLLTALAGQLSADEIIEQFRLSEIKLPTNLPISLPSKLIDQRPDLRAAEANMHAASAQVGVTMAARLPNITLSANGGTSAYKLAEAFTPGTGFYTLAASVTAPIFDGFTLYNRQKAAEASLAQAEAQYRAIVITAFQNVADALRALQADARAVKASLRAEVAAKASLDIIQSQLKVGQVNQLVVLNAQQTYLTALLNSVQAEANRLSDTAALFMALGGGWPSSCSSAEWRECAMLDDRTVSSH